MEEMALDNPGFDGAKNMVGAATSSKRKLYLYVYLIFN